MVMFESYMVSKSYLKIFCLSLRMVVLLVSKVGSRRIGQQRVGDLLLPAVAYPLPLFHAVVVVVVVDVDGGVAVDGVVGVGGVGVGGVVVVAGAAAGAAAAGVCC